MCITNVSTGSKAFCGVPIAKKLPGDGCTNETECESGSCTKNVCTGLAKGASCNLDKNLCDKSLYCDPWLKCSPVFKIDDVCAGYSFGCPFFSKCNVQADLTEKCVGYFALANDSPVADTDSYLCKSGFSAGDPGKHTCQDGPKLQGDRTVNEAQSTCKYSTGSDKLSVCGFGTENKAYCPFTSGDLTTEEVASLAKVATNSYDCSGLYFFKGKVGFECAALAMETDAGIKSALEKLYFVDKDHHFAFVQSNPDCIKESSIPDVNTFYQYIKGTGPNTEEEFLA